MSIFTHMKRTFRDALIEATGSGKASLKAVSDATGVSYEQLKKLKQGKSKTTNVEDAIAIAQYFNTTVEAFIDDPRTSLMTDLSELLARLDSEELEILKAAATGIASRSHSADPQSP